MGCCITKQEKDKENISHYHHLHLYEMDELLHKSTITCYFCKHLILHKYEKVTVCNVKKTVIGHSFCVSMYCDTECPACHNSIPFVIASTKSSAISINPFSSYNSTNSTNSTNSIYFQ